MGESNYSAYISLNKNFKDVFNLDSDLDTDLWRNYIFTDSFTEIISKIDFIFKSNNSKKKAIILTGKYGVGKSHTLAVISHLLWDGKSSIQELLDIVRSRSGIPGTTLDQYREDKKYFPVFLSGRDSSDVSDEKTFDFLLQKALESSLKKYGLLEKIKEKSDFELYHNWLKQHHDNKDSFILPAIETAVKKTGKYESIDELVEALDKRDSNSLSYIKDFFNEAHLPPPFSIDSFIYYENILKELQKIDKSIAGIIIYWDEFTTVFTFAGQNKKAKLLQKIQEWSQNASSNIILFLISHKHPEALKPLFPDYNDEFAKITDRFEILNMKMEKKTTYTLIENSIIIKNLPLYVKFLENNGFDSKTLTIFSNQFTDIFRDFPYTNDKLIRTFPLHPYSVFAATKIADSIGSAERSIFQLLHSKQDIKTIYGRKLGFSAFLEIAPSEEIKKLYTLDMVFDFFYDDFRIYSREEQPIIIQTMNSFSRFYSVVENFGADAVSVLKTIIVMQILHESSGDEALATKKSNIEKALYKSDVKKIESILKKLIDSSVLIVYDKGVLPEDSLYKIRLGDYDQAALNEEIQLVTKEYPFSRYISRHNEDINDVFRTSVSGVSRLIHNVKANHVEIMHYAASEFEKIKSDSKKFDDEGKLLVGLVLSQNNQEFEDISKNLTELSQKSQHHIFVAYDEHFDNSYIQWIEAIARKSLGQKNQQKPLFEEGKQLEDDERIKFKQRLVKTTIIFQGTSIKKIGSISDKVSEILQRIYPRGFDYLIYQQFWETPKKNHDVIFTQYGEANGKKRIEEDTNFFNKKILEVLRDKNGNPLIDSKLLLQDDESTRSSALFEIVSNVRSYLEKKTGSFISIQELINDLGLECPPYGLCGWYESIILVYALAEFKKENRLEVKLNNSTPLKDSNKILDALKDAITHSKSKDHQIRYGTSHELKFARKLINIFSLEDDTSNTLIEVCMKIRHKINNTFGLPIWVIPYAYEDKKKDDFEKCLTPLNKVIIEFDREKTFSDSEILEILKQISEIEKTYNKTIWATLLSKNIFQTGFENYVKSRQPSLILIYNDTNILIDQLKMNLEGECWAWNETKVTDFLAKILKTSIIPFQPQNVHGHFEDGGLLIKWDSPLPDKGIPLQYIIQRRDGKNDLFTETIDTKTTMYKDVSVIPGNNYTYQIIAQNTAGQSQPSNEYKIQLSISPPQIVCNIISFDDFFELGWEKFGNEFDLDYFKVLRGPLPVNLNELDVTLSKEISAYKDYDVKPGVKYFFRIDAVNKNGMKTKGIISPPMLLKKLPQPSPPINSSSALYQGEVQISWALPETGSTFIEKFCIYREDNRANKILLAILPSDQITFIDNSITAGETCSYSLTSKNAVGESNSVPCGIVTIPPSLPSDIKKWQSETISFAKKDSTLFFTQVNEVIGKLLATPPEDMDEKEKEALINIKKLLEGIIHE